MHWDGVRLCGPTRAVVSPATQRVVAAGWLGMSKATQATREGVTDLNFVIEPGLNHPVESTINQIQQTRNIETRWEGGEAIRWRAVPISPVQR